MATIQTVSPAAVRRERPRWHTLRLLKAGRLLLLALLGVLLGVLLATVRLQQTVMEGVGQHAAPGMLAAQQIRVAMASMDAEIAHELLTSPENGTSPVTNYDAARGKVAASLVTAAENLSFGEGERGPLRTLQNGLAVYEDLVQRARDLHALPTAGGGSDAVLEAYHQAQTMTDRSLLPAADDLNQANRNALEAAYRRGSAESTGLLVLATLVGVLALAALVGLQLFLSRRTRRTVNPALLGATLLSVALLVTAMSALAEAQRRLRVAKGEAFPAVQRLAEARALAFQANSEESRLLLDPGRAAAAQRAFARDSAALLQLPPGTDPGVLRAAESGNGPVPTLGGALGDELEKSTSTRDRATALHAVGLWGRFLEVDGEVRRLERAGHHREAVELSLGSGDKDIGRLFQQFDRSLRLLLEEHQRSFDEAVARGAAVLAGLEYKVVFLAVLIAALALAGLAPRIREYQ